MTCLNRRTTGALALLSIGALTACGDSASPVGKTQWQVTAIYNEDDTTHPPRIADSQQGRVFLTMETKHLYGASGCADIAGDVSWSDDQTQISFSNVEIRSAEATDEVQCEIGDQDNAERLVAALNDSTLEVHRPNDRTLKLRASSEGLEEWQTPTTIEMIRGAE